jgi:hypothetical protein
LRAGLPGLRDAAALALLHDLAVILDGRRGRGEDEAILAVEVRVEDDREIIAVGERDVADLFTRHDASGLAVVEPRADVERVAIREDAYFGAFRDGRAFLELTLDETRERLGGLPDVVIEASIDDGRLADGLSFRDRRCSLIGALSDRGGCGRAAEGGDE